MTLLRKACLAVCLVLSVRSLRAAYQPLVTRIELPNHASEVFFASPDVLASKAGVLELDTSGNWKRTSVTKPAYAVGGSAHKWWAAGKGFVALSNGQEVSFDDTGFSGVETNSGVFVSGERGIWRIVDGASTFVLPTSKLSRLLTLGDDLWALTDDRAMRWDGTKFMDSPWSGSRRVYYPFPWENGVYYGTTKGFAYYTPDAGETFAFPSISPVEIKKALTGFARDRDRLYSASYLAGLAAYDVVTENEIWRLTRSDLQGEPYSLVMDRYGLLVGLGSGAVRVVDAVMWAPLGGLAPCGTDGALLYTAGGTFNLDTGVLTKAELKPVYVKIGAIEARFGGIDFGNGKIVLLQEGGAVMAMEPHSNGYLALQRNALTLISPAGAILKQWPVRGTSMIRDGDSFLIGAADGLYRFSDDLVQLRNGAHDVYPGGVLVAGREIQFGGKTANVPGDVVTIREDFALVRTREGVCVGKFRDGWQPLDFPGLPGSASGLAVRNGFLYVLSPHGVFRADPAKLSPLTIRAPERVSTTLVGEDYEFNLPPRRPAPWASPVYQVRVNGRELELASHNVRVPRLPYGRTMIEVSESIAGLTSQQSMEVLRPRPWWISWQGGLVYVAITSSALWLLFRWRTRVLRLRAKHLERLVEERTNDLKSALQARELFYSSISHEIRNPLNGVVGMCDILAERTFGGRDQVFVRTLKSCATQLQRLLDDLLDMTRANRGRLVLRAEAFDLVQTVRNAAIAAEPTLATIEIDSPEELWVTGDPIRLQQVAYNLISNALKFGQPSRASVRLAVLAEGAGAKRLELVVRNSGPAISPAEREAIFEGFSRGAEAVKSGIPGTGLGLAVSRGIIVAMGGQLDFRRIGEETEFFAIFELPCAEHATGKAVERVSFSARALAIEDEHYNRLVLGHTLARLGIEADWAPDVASARRAFAEQKYDVVITDYRLPDGDGVSLAREFSAIHGCPPIIMLTAYSTDEKRQAAHNAGVGAVLTKPLSESELVRSLREVGLTPKDPVSAAHVHDERELDFTRILALENGEERLAEYCDEVERLLGELKEHASNSAVRERVSHTMKGRLALVRAQAACELCEKIEAVVEVEELRSLLDRLTDAVTEVVRKGRDRRRTVSV